VLTVNILIIDTAQFCIFCKLKKTGCLLHCNLRLTTCKCMQSLFTPSLPTAGCDRHCVFGSSIRLSVRPLSTLLLSIVCCLSVNTCFACHDISLPNGGIRHDTWHKYSSRVCLLVERLSRSQVRGEGHIEVQCTFPLEGFLHHTDNGWTALSRCPLFWCRG